MFNSNVGSVTEINGRPYITTTLNKTGHALYGPYDYLEAGDYVVEFELALAEPAQNRGDALCAVLDVAFNIGKSIAARKEIFLSQLQSGRTRFAVPFSVKTPSRFEYRAWVNGAASLVIADYRRVIPRPDTLANLEALLAQHRFPGEEGNAVPFFRDNVAVFETLYHRGVCVNIVDDAVVLTINGISMFARTQDDLNFIGEIFFEGAYNFNIGRDACVIDIGMNIGLATLIFARRPEVREVHSFEPFRNTFDRAMENIALNPVLAEKINASNCGLSDDDHDGTITVNQDVDSGAMSTVELASGTPVHVSLKDAAATLRPIIAAARADGRAVVVKVDCEGSEFAIFRSIVDAGLLPQISAFMVEWHAIFHDRNQEELLAPLRENGFIIFDRSPPAGNGFFYAARLSD